MSFSTLCAVIFWGAWALVAYTYVLFPVLLAIIAQARRQDRLHSPPVFTEDALPRVAMIVAAYNEVGVIAAKLDNTWQLDYPEDRFEILIGSDGSGDGTAAILEACENEKLRAFCFPNRRGKISVLNDLLACTDADIVVMSDANTMFSPDAIRKLVSPFQNPCVGCVSGELLLEQEGGVSGEGLYWKYEGWIKRNEGRLGFLIGCNGGIFALRRCLYDPLPASTIVEDFVLTLRVLEKGYRVHFEPEARATEPPCASARAEMIRKIRIGAGGWQALGLTGAVLHPRYGVRAFAFWGHKVLRWLVPFFCLTALLANTALALQGNRFYGLLLIGQVFSALLALWSYRAGPTKSLPKWTRPLSYFCLMNYALGCGFVRFLFGTQRVTWERAVEIPQPPAGIKGFSAK